MPEETGAIESIVPHWAGSIKGEGENSKNRHIFSGQIFPAKNEGRPLTRKNDSDIFIS
jgi:hypothetical protein